MEQVTFWWVVILGSWAMALLWPEGKGKMNARHDNLKYAGELVGGPLDGEFRESAVPTLSIHMLSSDATFVLHDELVQCVVVHKYDWDRQRKVFTHCGVA